jgi:cellulose synthase/poly-beta-1,6-N-acetylglucosamine synthase-like glycosyltransferase
MGGLYGSPLMYNLSLIIEVRLPCRLASFITGYNACLRSTIFAGNCSWITKGERRSREELYKPQALVARNYHPFFNFLFTYLFSIKFLYFFIISSLFSYFSLFVSISDDESEPNIEEQADLLRLEQT